MNDIKVKNAIVCEHVVEGKNNKYTLINTFSGNILVKEFPATIVMAFYIELYSQTTGVLPAVIKIMLGRKAIVTGSAEIPFKEGEPAILALPTGLIQIGEPTTLKLLLQIEGMKTKTIVEKSISVGQI